MTDGQKLDFVFYHLGKWKWSLGLFLSKVFDPEPEPNNSLDPDRERRENSRRAHVSQFLAGNNKVTPIEVVKLMYRHTYGRPSGAYYDARESFSTKTPSSQICYAQPALSTWALEIVVDVMRQESTYLVSKGGMRVRAKRKASSTVSESTPRAATNDSGLLHNTEDDRRFDVSVRLSMIIELN